MVYKNGRKRAKYSLIEFAQMVEEYGAGEIVVQSVDRDGTYSGYDLELLKRISKSVTVPVVALGGARDFDDFKHAVNESYASAVAAGSLFVYHGPRKAVLINYPNKNELTNIFK